MPTDDLTPLLTPDPDAGLGYRQGVIVEWDPQTGQNVIDVAGSHLADLPMLNISEALVLQPGHVVALLRVGTQLFILGRVVVPNTPEFFSGVMPNLTSPFYPSNTDAATQTNVNDSNWYSKFRGGHVVNHPKVTFGYYMFWGGAGQGQARWRWYDTPPANTANPPGGTDMHVSGTFPPAPSGGPYSYEWPAGMLGQLVYVSLEVRMTAGTTGVDHVSSSPTYFYGHG